MSRRAQPRSKRSVPGSAAAPTPAPARGGLQAKHVALAAALAAGLTGILYSATLRAPFVYDDVVIEECRPCRPERLAGLLDVLFARGLPRPVTMATFALNHYAGGPDPFGYHVVNLALHALVGTLLFVFACRLLTLLPAAQAWKPRAVPIAAVGALAWLLHPIQSQAVAYVWQRSTSLCALFFLGSLLAYLEARWGAQARLKRPGAAGGASPAALAPDSLRRERLMKDSRGDEGTRMAVDEARWGAQARLRQRRALLFVASAVLALLALGAKQNAGALPFFVLLLEAAFRWETLKLDRKSIAVAGLLVIAFLGIAAFYLGPRFLTLWAGEFPRRGFTVTERLLTELRVVVYYLVLLALPLPSRFNLDYDWPLSRTLPDPPSTLGGLAVIAALLGVAVWQFRRRRLLSLAILWFFGGLVIESTVIPLDLIYEHRVYLPSMLPIVFLAGLVLTRLAGRPRLRAAVVGAVLLLLAAGAAARAHVWGDPVRLFADTARKSPNKARVHANLGNAYLDRRQYAEAQRAFARALELDPGLTGAANNLALIHLDQLGQPAEARRLLEDAARRKPRDAGTRVNLAVACWKLGDRAEAIRQLQAARELDPEDRRILHNLDAPLREVRGGDPR